MNSAHNLVVHNSYCVVTGVYPQNYLEERPYITFIVGFKKDFASNFSGKHTSSAVGQRFISLHHDGAETALRRMYK